MIRSWKLQSNIPRRLIQPQWQQLHPSNPWRQYQPDHSANTIQQWLQLKTWAISQTKRKNQNPNRWSMILHNIRYIAPHHDSISKTTYLIPLKITKTTQLFEHEQYVTLYTGSIYSFNDFNTHGIINNNAAKLEILSLDFE